MPVTVVVGGQFGGEGKGKVAHFLAQVMKAKIAIRVGGTNSGHTVIDPSGNSIILRQLPTPAILPNIICVLPAGSYIDVDLLLQEMSFTNLSDDRLYIDPNAMIITKKEEIDEKNSSLGVAIGSTLSGTGAAVKRRIDRLSPNSLAKNDKRLNQFIRPTIPFMRQILDSRARIIIEGTQGFGLSLLHSPYYPYATSRDTTAASFLSESGLSPLDVDDVVMVIRAFPIRVGGNSGPLPHEIDWSTLSLESKSHEPLLELTSVTKKLRRVARFDGEIVRYAISVNQPTRIILNHLDYVDKSICSSEKLTDRANNFISYIESEIKRKIDFIGTGPKTIKFIRNFDRLRNDYKASLV